VARLPHVLATAILSVCPTLGLTPAGAEVSPTDRRYTVAPNFVRTDLEGHLLRLDQFRGRVVLLNFWATWCGPCVEEIPAFSRWQHKFGGGSLQVIGVSMDDDEGGVKRFIAKHRVAYPIVMGDAKLGESFGGIYGLPQSLLIDAQGRIVYRSVGQSNIEILRSKLSALIGIH
jgi:cytochrome c biogenesis protein CcmG, thiol:disulfide interchange protein DsbE